jgi:hypothetical protein
VELFREHVYGTAPESEYATTSCAMSHEVLSSEVALGGLATRREIKLRLDGPSGASQEWVVLLYLPASASGGEPVPCFLGLNFGGNHTVHADPGITESVVVEANFAGKPRGGAAERWQVEKVVSRGMALATVYSGEVEPDDPETAFSHGVHRLFSGYEAESWGTVAAVRPSRLFHASWRLTDMLAVRMGAVRVCFAVGVGAQPHAGPAWHGGPRGG